VNQHLQYTHGIGAAVLAANAVDYTTGNPNFVVSNVPPQSTNGMPVLTQPDVYFGITTRAGSSPIRSSPNSTTR